MAAAEAPMSLPLAPRTSVSGRRSIGYRDRRMRGCFAPNPTPTSNGPRPPAAWCPGGATPVSGAVLTWSASGQEPSCKFIVPTAPKPVTNSAALPTAAASSSTGKAAPSASIRASRRHWTPSRAFPPNAPGRGGDRTRRGRSALSPAAVPIAIFRYAAAPRECRSCRLRTKTTEAFARPVIDVSLTGWPGRERGEGSRFAPGGEHCAKEVSRLSFGICL